ncbi:hypothetical protein EV146_103299 [Mesobacillus foraminis]|uniref:Uncharacterized protein n=1 Tax=Mesobacillus foraminis TaxID=279826 RepID=A0A4R2BIR0_9BACI|nr:hypothetical protein EV146_103299 [Mesobacillus foraminis]
MQMQKNVKSKKPLSKNRRKSRYEAILIKNYVRFLYITEYLNLYL